MQGADHEKSKKGEYVTKARTVRMRETGYCWRAIARRYWREVAVQPIDNGKIN
jgi:hypothetical protein